MSSGKDPTFFLLSTLFWDLELMGILDIGSKATRSSARLSLSDLEDDMSNGLIVVKKGKVSSSLPPKRAHIDLTIKTPGSHKRKTIEAMDLSLENLRVEEAIRKPVFLSHVVSIS